MTPLRIPRTRLTLGLFVAFELGCQGADPDLPPVAQRASEPPELGAIATPAPLGPFKPVLLSPGEKAAIDQLRRRGASVTVFQGPGEALVHFPLGQLERQWRKDGLLAAECGVSIAYRFTPDPTGPPMTDADLAYLDELPRLTRVNLAGTQVTAKAIHAFRLTHPNVTVEEKDDE